MLTVNQNDSRARWKGSHTEYKLERLRMLHKVVEVGVAEPVLLQRHAAAVLVVCMLALPYVAQVLRHNRIGTDQLGTS